MPQDVPGKQSRKAGRDNLTHFPVFIDLKNWK